MMPRIPPAVLGLLLANGAMFALTYLVPGMLPDMYARFALWFPRHPLFGAWQFVTHMFMHGGFAHLFFNMFALFSFGLLLERLWGTRRFLIFFLLCGLGAGLVQTGVNWITFESLETKLAEAGLPASQVNAMLKTDYPLGAQYPAEVHHNFNKLRDVYAAPMLGASGAVYGVLVAFGLLFPNAKLALIFLPVPIAAKYFIPILLGLDVVGAVTGSFSLFGAHIAHFAHLGGALIGFLLMWYWKRRSHPLRPDFSEQL